MGKVDQGVFTHWMLSHHFRRPLRYIGYGGTKWRPRRSAEQTLRDIRAWTASNQDVLPEALGVTATRS
jgi:hypothetical protein